MGRKTEHSRRMLAGFLPALFLLLLRTMLATPCAAQNQSFAERQFKHYSISNGLSNNLTTSILQDRRGFVWVATNQGLNRFDGYSFKIFQHNPFDPATIGGNNICCLYEDRNGSLWAGLLNGWVSRFDPTTEQFTNYLCIEKEPNKPADGDISGIVEDAEGHLWIAIDRHGIIRFDPETGEIDRYESDPNDPNGLSHNAVTSIAIGRDDALWITTWGGGLNRFDTKTGRFTRIAGQAKIPDSRAFLNQKCQYHDRHGYIWIGTSDSGLYRTDVSLQHWWHYTTGTAEVSLGISSDSVNSLAEDADGNIWIATLDGGICIYDYETGRFEHIRLNDAPHSLRTNHITALCCDLDGSMWIGSSNGLHFYNKLTNRFNKYDIRTWDKQSEDGYIYSLLKLRNGNLLVKGRHNLLLFDRKQQCVSPVYYGSPVQESMRRAVMMEDSKGQLWFGYTHNYITRYDTATRQYENIQLPSAHREGLPFRFVRSFYEDTDGSIWIATEIGALNYQPQTKTFTPLFQSSQLIYPEDKVLVIRRDSYGDLWVGTEGGLKRYDSRLELVCNYIASMPNSIRNNTVTAIHEDREHTLWIGTREGLHRFDRATNTFTLLMRPNAKSGDAIMGIVEDNANNLWISSTTGIIQYNYADGTFRLYDTGDGLQSREFNQGVFSQGADGEILFGGISGFNAFYPDRMPQNRRAPRVYVTDMQIFHASEASSSVMADVPATTLDEIELKYWQSMVSFQFVALNYISPGQCSYAYMLEGVDNDWNYTPPERRFATYTNLSPGNYIFRVRASNNDGVWNNDGAAVRIVILPPLWETWWAYMLYILIGITLFVLILRYVAHREQVKARIELERLEAKQQHEADQLKLQLFTNISHEFRTSLTLIQGPLDYILSRGEPGASRPLLEIMRRNTARLKRLINQLLDFRKLEVSKLTVHLTTQDIIPCLNEVCDIYRFYAEQRGIRFSFEAAFAEKVMEFDCDKVDKILYNLLSNAFNYTDDGGAIAVEVDELLRNGEPLLRIRVKDTGMGIAAEELKHLFTLFYQVEGKESRYRGGSGLGLTMTRELVQLLGGEITVDSEKGCGSEFTVLLPVRNTGLGTEGEAAGTSPSPVGASVVTTAFPEPSAAGIRSERGVVLVVEDNGDMRSYIKQVLAPEGYRMLEASNGEQGLQQAVEQMPDIIISDVMMPVMDGREMLAHLKEDERIQHIPILLLTAVNEECEMIRSFEAGVDGYVTKPFSATLLCTRINSILDNRRKLLERYAASAPFPEGAPQSSYTRKYIDPFVAKMRERVAERLGDSEFDVDTLASQFCMSASQLTRKCRALMNDTPWNFIIKCRMERAAELIRESDRPISEVAWACGYTEKSNFSRAFAKHFGKSPSQYKKEA